MLFCACARDQGRWRLYSQSLKRIPYGYTQVLPVLDDINSEYEVTVMLVCAFCTCTLLIFGVWPLFAVYRCVAQRGRRLEGTCHTSVHAWGAVVQELAAKCQVVWRSRPWTQWRMLLFNRYSYIAYSSDSHVLLIQVIVMYCLFKR